MRAASIIPFYPPCGHPPATPANRDAAALACVCANAAAASRMGRWPRAVRIKRSVIILEPFSGAFSVTVAPGEDVQAAVSRCPRGGCVLLLPGTHEGPLTLTADQEVHVFGRGQATLRAEAGHVIASVASVSTVDGLVIRQEGIPVEGTEKYGVHITGGALRLQDSDISSTSDTCIFIEGGAGTRPVVTGCMYVAPYLRRLSRRPAPSPSD